VKGLTRGSIAAGSGPAYRSQLSTPPTLPRQLIERVAEPLYSVEWHFRGNGLIFSLPENMRRLSSAAALLVAVQAVLWCAGLVLAVPRCATPISQPVT